MGRLPLAFWPIHEFLCLYKLNKHLLGILGFFSPINHPRTICRSSPHDYHCTHLTFPTKCTSWLLEFWGPIKSPEPNFIKACHTVSFALWRITETEFLGDSGAYLTRALFIYWLAVSSVPTRKNNHLFAKHESVSLSCQEVLLAFTLSLYLVINHSQSLLSLFSALITLKNNSLRSLFL